MNIQELGAQLCETKDNYDEIEQKVNQSRGW
jgi:hypothetical protein